MLDFLMISSRSTKRGVVEIYPKFLIKKSSDLMIRGGDFYAVWVEERNVWSMDEHDCISIIDQALDAYAKEKSGKFEGDVRVQHLWDSSSGMIDNWHKYCQKQMRDAFHTLDEKLIFSNIETKKEDYVSRKLTYPLEPGDISAYDRLMATLYHPDERLKIEWAIGAVVSGESINIQKFLVLYGAAGTGKSTVLNIIQKLFDGYYSVFDAKALGSANNSFALESFKTNPLVAIQHDGDLSRIGDNTRLNSLVSHELMTVNEKFKSTYSSKFKCFLFMGTNKPVKITDAKSGIIRRLIDVSPSGNKLPTKEYKAIIKQVDFELGAIAYHCKEVYNKNRSKFDNYIPTTMLGASNDFYNYIEDAYYVFKQEDGVTMKAAWERYKTYCDEAKVAFPFSQRAFKEELKNYFREYKERYILEDGTRVRSYFEGFRAEKFESIPVDVDEEINDEIIISLKKQKSKLDESNAECIAQYATEDGSPKSKWSNTKTKLKDLNTSKLHWVKLPENHIVIDFDLKDSDGNKSLELNLKEASKWPKTYTEVSKSGGGVHLHYIYSGDADKLSRIYGDHVEIKVFTGNSSLRRKLTKCNDEPVNVISSGLPMKGEKVINFESVANEKAIRTIIKKNLNKEYHASTKQSIDFIKKTLDDAYDSGLHYDVDDLQNVVFAFAASSTNQSDICLKLVNEMRFKSDEPSSMIPYEDDGKIIFFDVEVFPNLFVICWKMEGPDKTIMQMINPTSKDVENLIRFKLVGFNNRRYDNHILYGRLIGYTNAQLYELSQNIINGKPNALFGEAYNLSYTDIYDFASAGNKKSLKKFEIDLGLHHQELGLPWDEPVPESLWLKVAEYCNNDVIATEATFNHLSGDWTARQILADVAGMTVNDSTNSLTTRIIFGNNRKPQDQFNYRNLGEPCTDKPYFEGYKYELGKSTYKNEDVGEGGYVYAEPGIYTNIALLDVASMHPNSLINENLLGDEYTKNFKDLVDARIFIKHKDYDSARKVLGGKLAKFLDSDKYTPKELSNALKTPINAVYGQTYPTYDNPFKDPRNIDNIVAKRGALFMIDLKDEVQRRGYTVAHIKTDSIKIPDATKEIIDFVMDFGKQYGYTFEHEATYDKMCLVNDAVYIAKYKGGEDDGKWTATGAQFAVPYVFKKLFSKEDIVFSDLCETKAVKSALYLDMNEKLPDVSGYEKERDKIWKKLLSDKPVSNDDVVQLEKQLNELDALIETGHNYIFIGKVGLFCPIKEGFGGGILLRQSTNSRTGKTSYSAVTGSKGYRWLEAEMVSALDKQESIDRGFYDSLVDSALSSISKYGDAEWFMS